MVLLNFSLFPLRQLLNRSKGGIDALTKKLYLYWLITTPPLVNLAHLADGDVVASCPIIVELAVGSLYLPARHRLVLGCRTLTADHLRTSAHLPARSLAFSETLGRFKRDFPLYFCYDPLYLGDLFYVYSPLKQLPHLFEFFRLR